MFNSNDYVPPIDFESLRNLRGGPNDGANDPSNYPTNNQNQGILAGTGSGGSNGKPIIVTSRVGLLSSALSSKRYLLYIVFFIDNY